MRILVLAPHADDEVFGCGGVLAKYPAEATVLVAAEMSPIREHEAAEAQKALGYRWLQCLNFKDGHVGDDSKKLVSRFDEALMALEPEILYVPFPGSHQDHIAVYEAGVRAARQSMSRIHYSPPQVLVYDVAAYDLELYESGIRWNCVEQLTEVQVSAKAAAMECYESQRMQGGHPANGVTELAASIGAGAGVQYGEKFSILREVR